MIEHVTLEKGFGLKALRFFHNKFEPIAADDAVCMLKYRVIAVTDFKSINYVTSFNIMVLRTLTEKKNE
jgi:hypothetical protein